MATEYYAVICEISPRALRIGFAGESIPLVCLEPSLPLWRKYRPSSDKDIYPRLFDLDSHLLTPEQRKKLTKSVQNSPEDQSLLETYRKDAADGKFVFWGNDAFRALGRLMKHIITKELMVSPRNVKLMVLDYGYSAVERFQLCRALLGPAGCAHSVYFISRAPCVSMSASVEDAIIVDFGWLECRISVLGELRIVKETGLEELCEEVICYRALRDTGAGIEETLDYLVKESSMLLDLPAAIARLVGDISIDLRPQVLQNIVFCSSVVPLSTQRELVKQIQQLLPKLQVSGKHCLGAWAGASIYCSTTLLKHDLYQLRDREVTAEKLATGAWKKAIF